MNIFVINSGSSSIKYQLIRMPEKTVICSGIVESIGLANAKIIHKTYINGKEEIITESPEIFDHSEGLKEVTRLLTHPTLGVINDPSDITAVGHRVVHGGENLAVTTLISNEVKDEIKRIFPLAPLHNPAHHLGIASCRKYIYTCQSGGSFRYRFLSYAASKSLPLRYSIRILSYP